MERDELIVRAHPELIIRADLSGGRRTAAACQRGCPLPQVIISSSVLLLFFFFLPQAGHHTLQ